MAWHAVSSESLQRFHRDHMGEAIPAVLEQALLALDHCGKKGSSRRWQPVAHVENHNPNDKNT